MSTVLCDLVDINAIQDRLDAVHMDGSKHLAGQPTPVLDFVMSAENKAAFDMERQMTRDGKIRGVQLRFEQSFLPSEVSSNGEGCDATGEYCQVWQDYAFDPTLNEYMDFKLGVGELKTNPEENTAVIAQRVRLMIQAIKEKVHENLSDYIVANLGNWSSDTPDIEGVSVAANILNVNTTLPNDSNASRIANPILFQQLQDALSFSGYGSTGVFGGTELASYVKRASAGSDSVIGYNLKEALDQFGVAATYDRVLAAKLAASLTATNAAVGIGAIAPVGWSLYDSDGAKLNLADSVADTIYDPATGMKFEFRMTRDCDDWKIVVRTRYQFFGLPENRYKTGHPLEGTNSLGGININCTNQQSCIA